MIVTEVTQAQELAEQLKHAKQIVFDVETHKTDQYYNKELLGVAIGIPRGIELDTYYVLPGLFHVLHSALETCEWIGHNIKFDLEICRQNGLDFQGPIVDTQILCHLINENFQSYELDWLGQTQVGLRKEPMAMWEKAFMGWNNIPPVVMGTYAEQDLRITWRLYLKFILALELEGLADLWPETMRYVRTLQTMIRPGIRADRTLLSDLSREAGIRLSELSSQLAALGISNPGSTKQVQRYLYTTLGLRPINWTKPPKRKDGTRGKPQPSTDNATLNAYIELNPNLEEHLSALLEYRTLSKAKSTWYDGFITRMGDRTTLHPGFKQHGTKTGRISCAEPNLQQIPRNSKRVKRVFLDTEDSYLVEFDYKAVELYTGSWYFMKMGDPTMFELLKAGEDLHAYTGKMIGSIDRLGHKEGRQVGKTGNFLWIYQGGPAKLRSTLWRDAKMRVELADCQRWTAQFHAAYPGVMRINNRCRDLHAKNGYIKMYNGRRRRIIDRDDEGRIKHWAAFNSINQGAGSQIMMSALNNLIPLQERGAPFQIVSTVHDSVWALLHKEHVEEAVDTIVEIMVEPANKQFDLPFQVEWAFMPGSKGATEWQPQPTNSLVLST